jgi:hypothetical protein
MREPTMANRCFAGAVSCLAIVTVSVAVAGCTYKSDGVGGPGTLTVNRPGTLPSPPPPSQPPPAPGDAVTPPPDGRYEGVAHIRTNPGGACRHQFQVRNFVVTGDRIRYEAFRGRIRPDMSVRLRGGNSFIQGSFDGGTFTGRLWRPQPSCTYDIVLTHIG